MYMNVFKVCTCTCTLYMYINAPNIFCFKGTHSDTCKGFVTEESILGLPQDTCTLHRDCVYLKSNDSHSVICEYRLTLLTPDRFPSVKNKRFLAFQTMQIRSFTRSSAPQHKARTVATQFLLRTYQTASFTLV